MLQYRPQRLLLSARNFGLDPQAYLKHLIEFLPASRAAAKRTAYPALKSSLHLFMARSDWEEGRVSATV